MPVHVIQPSFAGGEFGPALHKRVDIQKFSTALKTAKNFIIRQFGGAERRPGFEFRNTCRTITEGRLLRFEFSESDALTLEFGTVNAQSYIRFYQRGVPITSIRDDWTIWDVNVNYQPGQYVNYLNNLYICTQFNAYQNTPTSTQGQTFWELVATADPFPYEIRLPYTADEIQTIKYTQSGDTLYFACPTQPPMTLKRLTDKRWSIRYFNSSVRQITTGLNFITRIVRHIATFGPFRPSNTDYTQSLTLMSDIVNGQLVYSLNAPNFALFEPGHVGSLFSLSGYVGTTVGQDNVNSSITETPHLNCVSTWRVLTANSWSGTLVVELYSFTDQIWREAQTLYSPGSNPGNFNTFGTVTEYQLVRVRAIGSIGGNVAVTLTVDGGQVKGAVRVTNYVDPSRVNVEIVDQEANLLNFRPTTNWAEGAWSDVRGYPQCVGFFQDRLGFGCTYSDPQTSWYSQTSNYVDFSFGQTITDTDEIGVNLPSRSINAIRDFIPFADINITLTSGAEWTVGPGQSGSFTPTSVEQRCQGYHGSSKVPPVTIGNRAIFVQAQGSVVRDLSYTFTAQGYESNDISILSYHLLQGHQVKEMAYQQEPNSLIWILRDDGILLSVTYMIEQQVLAWTQHETLGRVQSIVSIPGDGFDELYAMVFRNGDYRIERLHQPTFGRERIIEWGVLIENVVPFNVIAGFNDWEGSLVSVLVDEDLRSEQILIDRLVVGGVIQLDGNVTRARICLAQAATSWYLDSAVRRVSQTAFTQVTGLNHLEGMEVQIYADGLIQDPQIVAGGMITLASPAVSALVGIGYASDFETIGIELQTPEGSIQGRKVKVSQVTMEFLNSKGGMIGPDAEHLTPLNQLYENLNQYTLFSGEHIETINSNYEGNGKVFFRQTDPYPTTIIAAIPRLTVGGG